MGQIILIEDNEQSARLAAKLLKHAGHDVIVATDGETGLTTIFENQADLVLVDLGLPDIDGQTVVAVVRQQEGDVARTPVIAFTAWPQEAAEEMALAYGCDGVITKPIDTRTFADQVNAFMQKAAT